jgi:hypothetical protein
MSNKLRLYWKGGRLVISKDIVTTIKNQIEMKEIKNSVRNKKCLW